MKTTPFFQTVSFLTLLVLLLSAGCKQDKLERQFEALPELPSELAATLDTHTLATNIPAFTSVNLNTSKQDKIPELAAAPCCENTDYKALQVMLPYTKCAPLREFLVVPLGDLSMATEGQRNKQGVQPPSRAVSLYKYKNKGGLSILDRIVCVSSDGPWEASLVATTPCSPYITLYSLTVSAFGDQFVYEWTGGLENHPAEIQLVSCRQLGNISLSCGISTCSCSSSHCPEEDPCTCTLNW
ncbi:MAG: hypothetical protein JNL02_16810 [Saprospiraceae bacterium]|nr:hypothetical protein [Saprospiraceae bacterium]